MIMLAGLSDMDDERTWFEKNRAEIRQQGTGRLSVYYRKGTRTMLIFSDRNALAPKYALITQHLTTVPKISAAA
jgi:hypothetical protein